MRFCQDTAAENLKVSRNTLNKACARLNIKWPRRPEVPTTVRIIYHHLESLAVHARCPMLRASSCVVRADVRDARCTGATEEGEPQEEKARQDPAQRAGRALLRARGEGRAALFRTPLVWRWPERVCPSRPCGQVCVCVCVCVCCARACFDEACMCMCMCVCASACFDKAPVLAAGIVACGKCTYAYGKCIRLFQKECSLSDRRALLIT